MERPARRPSGTSPGWCAWLLALALALALATAGAAASPAVAAVTATQDGSTIWSVRPAGADGADGRAWVEENLDPGARVTEYMEIRNLGDHAATFSLRAADGYFTDTGRFTMLPRGEESHDAGSWIELQDSVVINGGETVVLPFTIAVPLDAAPGDHPGGVAASVLSNGTGLSGSSIAVDSRVGFRVMIRVSGELRPDMSVTATAEYHAAWSPFVAGSVTIEYTVRNTGNTRLSVAPAAHVTGLLGSVAAPGAEIVEFAPGESRTGTIVVAGVWPVVAVEAAVKAESTAIPGLSNPVVERETRTTMLAMPWPQLALVLLIASAVFVAVKASARRRARIDEP